MMVKERPAVNVMWTTPGVPDAAGETTRISFYTIDNDGVCRHFSIDAQMVRSGPGWLYDGPVPGAALIRANANGNPACPA